MSYTFLTQNKVKNYVKMKTITNLIIIVIEIAY